MARSLTEFEIRLLLNAKGFERGADDAEKGATRASRAIDLLQQSAELLGKVTHSGSAGLETLREAADAGTRAVSALKTILADFSGGASSGLAALTNDAYGVSTAFELLSNETGDVVDRIRVLNALGIETNEQLRAKVKAIDVVKQKYADEGTSLRQLNDLQDRYLRLLGETTNAQERASTVEARLNALGIETSSQIRQKIQALTQLRSEIENDDRAYSLVTQRIEAFNQSLQQAAAGGAPMLTMEQQLAQQGIVTTKSLEAQVATLRALQKQLSPTSSEYYQLAMRLEKLNDELTQSAPIVRAHAAQIEKMNALGIRTTEQLRKERAEIEKLLVYYRNSPRDVARLTTALKDLDQELTVAGRGTEKFRTLEQQLNDIGIQSSAQIRDKIAALQALKAAYENDIPVMQRLAVVEEHLNTQLNTTKVKSRQAEQALFGLGFILDDSRQFAYGFDLGLRAIANNIQPLILSLGTMEGGLKALASAFWGVGGIILAFNAVTLALPWLIKKLNEGGETAQETKERIEGLTQAVGGLVSVTQDLGFDNISVEQLEQAKTLSESRLDAQRKIVDELEQEHRALSAVSYASKERQDSEDGIVTKTEEVKQLLDEQKKTLSNMEATYNGINTELEKVVESQLAYNLLAQLGLTDLRKIRKEAEEWQSAVRSAAGDLLSDEALAKYSTSELQQIAAQQQVVNDKAAQTIEVRKQELSELQKQRLALQEMGQTNAALDLQYRLKLAAIEQQSLALAEQLAFEEEITGELDKRAAKIAILNISRAAGMNVSFEEEESGKRRKTLLEQEVEKRKELLKQVAELRGGGAELVQRARNLNEQLELTVERMMALAQFRILREMFPQEDQEELRKTLNEGLRGPVKLPIEFELPDGQGTVSLADMIYEGIDLDLPPYMQARVHDSWAQLMRGIEEQVLNDLERINKQIDDKMFESTDRFQAASDQIVRSINSVWDDLARNISGVLEDAFAGTSKGSGQLGAALLKTLGDLSIKIGQIMIGLGTAMLKLDPVKLLTPLGAAGAIAAGAALLALGAAARGAAKAALSSATGRSVGGSSGGDAYNKQFRHTVSWLDREARRKPPATSPEAAPVARTVANLSMATNNLLRAADTLTARAVMPPALQGAVDLNVNVAVQGKLSSERGAFDAEIRGSEHRNIRLRM